MSWAFTAVFAIAARLVMLAVPAPFTSDPEIWTDKTGYLAGEPIRIAGEGFSSFERITLQVIHEDGTAEAGAGHEPFYVKTDAEGQFEAAWAITRDEGAGLNFVLNAEGVSGLRGQSTFVRIGEITGGVQQEGIRIKAEGFNTNELVAVKVNDGHDHPALSKLSDASGALIADLDLPGDNPNAAVYTVTASGNRSALTLQLTVTDYVVVNHQPNGVPALEELRAQNGLAQIGYRDADAQLDYFIRLNSAGERPGFGQGNACALFDTGDDGRIDFAICSRPGTAATPSTFLCDNERIDRCGNPAPYRTPAQVAAHIQAGSLNDLGGGAANSTLRVRVSPSFLPPDAELASVCVYALEAESDAGPLDCIVLREDDTAIVATASVGPALTGRVVYHSYASYNDGTSQLFILNLATSQLTNISSGWTNLKDPMNAHWSPDGTKIVFMARPGKGRNYSAYFDIFLYVVGQSGNPVNLTNTKTRHDEDPKFSPDGSRIVYKMRPSIVREMNLNGSILGTIISSSGYERSMPYYTANAAAVWYSSLPDGAGGEAASIRRINVNGTSDAVAVDTPGVIDFYPIQDTIGQFLYSRTVSPTNLYGQVYMFDGAASISLPFNTTDADYNDAFPLGAQYIVVSSTRAGGRGGYDLYVADRNAGTMWPMSGYNAGVNTSREELGAAYTAN